MSTNYWPKYSSSLHDYLAALDVSVFYGIIEIILKPKISCVRHLHGLAIIYISRTFRFMSRFQTYRKQRIEYYSSLFLSSFFPFSFFSSSRMANNSALAIAIYWPPKLATIKCRLLLGRLGRRTVQARIRITCDF